MNIDNELPQYILPEGYIPQPHDILCGKTKVSFNHVGNRRFRVTISLFLQRYRDLKSRSARGALIASVVDMILKNGGHFLSFRSNHWVTLTSKQARCKVGHALRDANFKQKKTCITIRPREVDDKSLGSSPNNRQRNVIEPMQTLSDPTALTENDLFDCSSLKTNDAFGDSAKWSEAQLEFLLFHL